MRRRCSGCRGALLTCRSPRKKADEFVCRARHKQVSINVGERQVFTEFAESALRDLTERDVDLAIEQGSRPTFNREPSPPTVVQAATVLAPASAL
jgi:hypothetical protein